MKTATRTLQWIPETKDGGPRVPANGDISSSLLFYTRPGHNQSWMYDDRRHHSTWRPTLQRGAQTKYRHMALIAGMAPSLINVYR